MRVNIKLTEDEIKVAIVRYIVAEYGVVIKVKDVPLLVKSKQNYRSEWEAAAIKVDGECEMERIT